MTALSLRARGQLRNESVLLVDHVIVTRRGTNSGVIDPDTGLPAELDDEQVWSGPAWLKLPGPSGDLNVAGDVVTVARPTCALPLSAPRLAIGDIIQITASPVHFNVGVRCAVSGIPAGSFLTLARYPVEVQQQ